MITQLDQAIMMVLVSPVPSDDNADLLLTLKEPGAESAPPPSTFFVISQPVFFFRAETS